MKGMTLRKSLITAALTGALAFGGLALAHGLQGTYGPGYGMGPGMMGGRPMAGMDQKQHQDFTQRRLDVMQVMMEQMMQHQQMMQPAPAK